MTDAFIYNIAFIFALAYEVTDDTDNHVMLSEPENLECSVAVQVMEIVKTSMNEININQLCAIIDCDVVSYKLG